MAAVALLPRCWLSRHATKVARRHLTRGLGSSGQAPAAAPGAVATRIVYVTDCEGNLGYLLQCIELAADASSRGGSGCHAAIRAVEHDGSSRLELADDAHFVFGGDTVDHGGRDIGVLSTLLDLKRRHPSRVHFLLGNRDINKMRLSAELERADLDRDPAEIPAQYWLPASQRLPLARFLETVAAEASTHVERISKSISFVPTSQRAAPQKPVPE